MKYLIAYHTQGGNNSQQAQELFHQMTQKNIDVRVLKVMPKISCPLPVNGIQGVLNYKPKLKEEYNLDPYDVIILCGPVWAGSFSPVLSSLIKSSKSLSRKKFFISPCCFGDAKKPIAKVSKLIQSKGGSAMGGSYIVADDLKDMAKLKQYVGKVVQKCAK